NGNLLFEDYPGLAKTLMTNTFADALGCDFKRVSFTPDLLPADITGTNIYDAKKGEFTFKPGPIFCNLLLSDEINRAPPKTQAALLEAMQEKQVTIGVVTHKLPSPFLTMATQNPIEQEGTYPLPEAQVDRFMLKVLVDYPTREEERLIVDRMTGFDLPEIKPVVTQDDILRARNVVRSIYVDDKVKEYVLDLVQATRSPENGLHDLKPLIAYGASPRASIYLITAARAHAFLRGRGYVAPEDVKQLAGDVLRHRVITTYEAEAESITSTDLVQRILDSVEVP
ncbi:MAG TPA: ATPase, partial [Dehalococcoidia bacterium]|nr:ATPase [Dehalococcoidia bacterium]